VHGQPTNVGVYVDACHDIGRIENVHFNPWYSDAPAYLAWQQAHGIGFQLMDTDWEFVSNTFTISGGDFWHAAPLFRISCHHRLVVIASCCGVLAYPDDFAVIERAICTKWTASRHCCGSLHERFDPNRSGEFVSAACAVHQ
jgi:hypothetical protein